MNTTVQQILAKHGIDAMPRAEAKFSGPHGHMIQRLSVTIDGKRQEYGSAMFFSLPKRADLVSQFGSEEIADRYLSACQDYDK